MANPLQEKAMLVAVSVSAWTASKKDNRASESVKAQNAANAKAGWFNKRLVDPTSLQPISKVEGRIRDFHYKMTLPWSDNGDRVLPGMAYMEYTDGLRALKSEFEREVGIFCTNYPQLVQDARTMLGNMYEPGDYPTVDSIKGRFGVTSTFSPIPDAADFRVDVGAEAVEEIRRNITANVEQRLVSATQDCWVRLEEALRAMYERLSDEKAVFRDSLVENLRVLTHLLPKLNVANDKNLDETLADVRLFLLIEPDDLRRNKRLRQITANHAGDIMRKVQQWITPKTN